MNTRVLRLTSRSCIPLQTIKMKKIVLKVDIHDERNKKKAMKTVSGLTGIDSIAVDMKDGEITLTGDMDPVQVVDKLRKHFQTDIVSVGPAKEPEKPKVEDKKPNPVPVPTYVLYRPYYHNYVLSQCTSRGMI